MQVPRANVLGVGVSAVNQEQAIALVMQAAHRAGFAGYVTATGVHGVMASQDDPELKRIHNRSFLSLPDGQPMVWAGQLQGHSHMGLVYGPDFMRAIMAHTMRSGERHFLWGGGDGVVTKLKAALVHDYPGVNIVASITPPFRPLQAHEETALVEEIVRTRPHFVWVGLSTPKQERFMAELLQRHAPRLPEHGLVWLGVGAAFDFLAGTGKEPPAWLRGTGLQWLYRMLAEPRRLGPRYLHNNPRFLLGACKQLLQPKRFPMES